MAKGNKSKSEVKITEKNKSFISFSFLFYNYTLSKTLDTKIIEILTLNKINYFFLKIGSQNELVNNKNDLVNTDIISLYESIVFVDFQSQHLNEEIENWISAKSKLDLKKVLRLYSKQNIFKGNVSTSVSIQPNIAKDIITESFFIPNSNDLLNNRLSQIRNSSGLVSVQEKIFINKIPINIINYAKNIYNAYIKTPLKINSYLTTDKILKFENPLYKLIWISLMIISFFYVVIGSQNVGIHSDEYRYMDQAEKVLNFYTSFGKDTSATVITGIDPLHYGIQIVDNFIYSFGKLFNLEDNYNYRHFIVSLICFFTIYFSSLIALKLRGYRLASITVLLMILSPVFIGNGFNNERDFIGVLGMVTSIYGMLSLAIIYPLRHPKYLLTVFLGLLFIGGQRVAGGAICLLFIGIWSVAIMLLNHNNIVSLIKSVALRKWLWSIAATCVISYIVIILIWPYGLISPIKHFLEVLKFSNKVTVGLNQIFEGKYLLSTNMPPYYLIKYLIITLPVAIWLGLLFLILTIRKLKEKKLFIGLISFVFVFVILYAYIKLSTMYGSWRQFLLIFPFMAISSSIGWELFLIEVLNFRKVAFVIIFIVASLLHPLQFIIRNHPFEYLYYNEIIGGSSKAYGNYEWDYAFNSLRQGAEWLKKYIRKHHSKGTKLSIATNGVREFSKYFEGFDDSVKIIYTRYYERGNANWDYAVFPNIYIHPFQLKNHIFPKRDSLHFINVDGEPVCFIYKRNNRNDLSAMQSLARGDIATTISELTSYLKYNPKSEWAWFQLAYMYAQQNDFAQSQTYLNEAFKFHPEFLPALSLQGLLYQNTGRCKDAQPIFLRLIKDSKYDLSNTYKWSAMCYETDNNYKKALEQYGFALGAGNKQKDTYAKIANCLRQLGDHNQAAKYDAMAN